MHTGTCMHVCSTHQGQASYRHKCISPAPRRPALPSLHLTARRWGSGAAERPTLLHEVHTAALHGCVQQRPWSQGPMMGLWSQAQVQPAAGLDALPPPSPPSLSPQHAHTHACTLLAQKTDSEEGTRNDGMQIANAHQSKKKHLTPPLKVGKTSSKNQRASKSPCSFHQLGFVSWSACISHHKC